MAKKIVALDGIGDVYHIGTYQAPQSRRIIEDTNQVLLPTKLGFVKKQIHIINSLKHDQAVYLLSKKTCETLRTTLFVEKHTLTVDEVTATFFETDSLKDAGGSSHADGLVVTADQNQIQGATRIGNEKK
ncbi:hypothetical protein RJ640_003842 [Escallonia rubra]|uniref:Uncharacterized protein n=1 Tax=Escallonia rubra TaxID=112253 RepID=A0AA88UJN6_9ASTE|nr:hypothetical protein RJ640_003842 [Escallonia rubra]